MSDFWPSDLEVDDIQSPREILESAKEDWDIGSNGVMTLTLQDTTTTTDHAMIIVHAKHMPSNRTSRLFSVVHRPDNPYPVTLQPDDETLPNFLMKSYTDRGWTGLEQILQEREIVNQWVSDTPTEFRRKLSEILNQGVVKSKVLNLISNPTNNTNGKPREG